MQWVTGSRLMYSLFGYSIVLKYWFGQQNGLYHRDNDYLWHGWTIILKPPEWMNHQLISGLDGVRFCSGQWIAMRPVIEIGRTIESWCRACNQLIKWKRFEKRIGISILWNTDISAKNWNIREIHDFSER